MFATVDVNDNGVLSLDEWKTHCKYWKIDPAHAEVSFLAMDRDRDGSVTVDE